MSGDRALTTEADVRRIALALPGVTEDEGRFMFRVDGKHFAWAWLERVDPKKARVENRRVLVVRVAGDIDKQMLLAMDRKAFFTEPHYDGYAAVLVRLAEIDRPRLKELITNAWRLRAPAEVGADATRSDSRAPRPHRAGAGSRARPSRPRRA